MTPVELAQKYKLVTLSQDHLALNDDLVHDVLIVGDEGAMQPGIQIKDLNGDADSGIVVEYAFVDTLIQNLIAAKQRLTPVIQEMVKEKMASSPEDALVLARKFIGLHNAAAKEYKDAFARVGAKMWHDDNAHPIPAENVVAVATSIEGVDDPSDLFSIVRPLTVLDSYPNVSNADRKKLNAEVDEIQARYQKQLDRIWSTT